VTFETLHYETGEGVGTITLARPERLNAFDQRMLEEFAELWAAIRADADVRAVVLQADGDRAFSSGLDRRGGIFKEPEPFSRTLPSQWLGPKSNRVFTPVICAVHGICAGGAFYWLAESDIVICSDDAEFFDPHVSYGMTSPAITWSLQHRAFQAEILRMSLMGLDERVTATRAREIGLVSEVVPADGLRARARELALRIAAKPASVVQATVRAAWDAAAPVRGDHASRATQYSTIANPLAVGSLTFGDRGSRPEPERR